MTSDKRMQLVGPPLIWGVSRGCTLSGNFQWHPNIRFWGKADIKMETMVADYFAGLSVSKSAILKENSSFPSSSLRDS